ncbi:MAG: hypothetical protein COS08_03515 [Euryarchaeota archaeon CG01_land_8_20_14_3_00_38_12]|nr:MAG: hypothetical protein COS08_03515 [Euryarchaeota archaeon CG01_land_8_20_14_3_00_38_12]
MTYFYFYFFFFFFQFLHSFYLTHFPEKIFYFPHACQRELKPFFQFFNILFHHFQSCYTQHFVKTFIIHVTNNT